MYKYRAYSSIGWPNHDRQGVETRIVIHIRLGLVAIGTIMLISEHNQYSSIVSALLNQGTSVISCFCKQCSHGPLLYVVAGQCLTRGCLIVFVDEACVVLITLRG